jgi:hypothetical protein
MWCGNVGAQSSHGPIAQSVERGANNATVAGSIPAGTNRCQSAKKNGGTTRLFFPFPNPILPFLVRFQ